MRQILKSLELAQVFNNISGVVVGKPQDEEFYEEYKAIWLESTTKSNTPIVYNLNFGHAAPRCILPYGGKAEINLDSSTVTIKETLCRY